MVEPEQTIMPLVVMRETVIGLTIESWRISQVFNRLLPKLSAGEQRRHQDQSGWFNKKIEEDLKQAGLRIVNFKGKSLDSDIATTQLNLENFEVMAESELKTITLEIMRDTVISMAIESWRFSRVFNRLLSKLDAGEQNKYQSQLHWFIKQITKTMEQAGLKIVNIEGHYFDPGMAATPLNIEDFDIDDTLIVEQMLEPIIMEKEKLLRTGTVTLRKVEL